VVDDFADAADSLAILLGMLGYQVRIAYDGPAALALSSEFRPHVVLLDIGLPILDGYEVAGLLRQQPGLQSLCLIAVSGFGSQEDRQRIRRAGFDHHLLKPLNLPELTAILDLQAARADS
jgi:CheY-like chemotaxis protein